MVSDPAAIAHAGESGYRLDQEREILAEAARAILSYRALEPLAEKMSELATRLVSARSACVMTWNAGRYMPAGSHGDEIDHLLVTSGFDIEHHVERHADADARERRVQRLEYGPGFVVVPLALTAGAELSETIDAFLLVGRGDNIGFDRVDLRVLQELGALLAVALRNIELYEAMERANRALRESSEFKGDLLAILAHDFNGPLTVIVGYCELLLASEREHREEIEMIYAQTRRLMRLSDDALVLAHTQAEGFSLARTIVDLATFIAESVEVVAPNNARVVVDVPSYSVPVEIDPPRFRHVVDNLVLNALKYSIEEVVVSLRVEGSSAVMDVSDRGIGVPADEVQALFTRFGRASNARRRGIAGSGIGLYVARKIVAVHRGSLTVRSIEDEGSTFTVILPLCATDAQSERRGQRLKMENR